MATPCGCWTSIVILLFITIYLCHSGEGRLLGKNCTHVPQCGDRLICNQTCMYCESDSQCAVQGKLKICKSKHCAHKGLAPLSFWDPVVMIILFTTGVVVAGAGVGGGGIFVPVLILAGGFLTKEAVPLSNTLICGASLANYIQLARLRHPAAPRPLIYYDLALLVLPLIISGTIIGVILYSMSPTWAILGLLVIVLLTSATLTFRKGIRTYKMEAKAAKSPYAVELQEPAAAGGGDSPSNTDAKKPQQTMTAQSSFYYIGQSEVVARMGPLAAPPEPPKLVTRSSFVNFGRTDIQLSTVMEAEKHTPWLRVAILFGIVAVVSVFSVLKGKNSGKSLVGVVACGGVWWALTWLPFILLIITSGGVVLFLIDAERVRQDLGYQHIKGDITWTRKNTLIISAVAIASGIVSSLVGIGGGMLLGPVMLELGILPDVTAATSSFMILFTSTASVAQYAALGALAYDYSGIFFVSGFIASFLGQFGLSKLVKRFKKKSYIIFLILGIIVGSCIMLTAVGIMNITKSIKYHTGLSFKKVCAPSD